jgi:fatty acid desaturase
MSQGSQVAGFSADYLLDLVTRFINWQMIGALFVLLVAWLFLAQWIRVTVFVVAIMIWLNVLTIVGPAFTLWPQSTHKTPLPQRAVRWRRPSRIPRQHPWWAIFRHKPRRQPLRT